MVSRRYVYVAAGVLALLCLLLAEKCRAAQLRPETASAVVASMVKAYGGTEAVGRIVSETATGRIREYVNDTSGTYARYLERPGKLRIEVTPEQGGEIRILNGTRGWRSSAAGYVAVSPLELQSMVYQYSYLDLPMGLVHHTLSVSLGGKEAFHGRDVYRLLVSPRDAPQIDILVDAKTFLIVRVGASFSMGMMGAGELVTEYGDYRVTAGVPFPHRLTNFAGDMKLSEILLDEIRINEKIPPVYFSP